MKTRYVLFREDSSFDWAGGTHVQYDEHGFEVEIGINDKIDLSTLEGFGAFADVEECKTLEEFYQYIENNKCYADNDDDEDSKYTTFELLLELQQIIVENLRQKKGDFSRIAYAKPKWDFERGCCLNV